MLRSLIADVLGSKKAAAPPEDAAAVESRLAALAADIQPVHGWLHAEAGKVLYQLARFHAPVPTIVELGSWKGRSTCWLASGIRDRGEGHVYAVDTWKGTQNEAIHGELLKDYEPDQLKREFEANLATRGLRDVVTPIVGDSAKAVRQWDPDRPIGVLFIDADHEYSAVRRDFECWSPFVTEGGFIVFDDVPSLIGPSRLISELPRWYSVWGMSPNNWIVIKTGA
jgi:predicted O-methyltransferase YrrM